MSQGASAGDAVALYVTGPAQGTRHLLRPGALVRIGRGADSTIVVDDPRVSRAHALLHMTDAPSVSDLGSANGTFVGQERLRAGEARPLALGETFSVGSSTLVLQPTGLAPVPIEQTPALGELAARWRRSPPGQIGGRANAGSGVGGFVCLLARVPAGGDAEGVAAVLGGLLAGPEDWLVHLDATELVVGVGAPSAARTSRLERSALEQLAAWNLSATIEAAFLPYAECPDAAEAGLPNLRGGGSLMTIARGDVVMRAPAMQALRRTLTRVAPTPIGLLILGETGVGKDVVASVVHELSPRADKPLVRLNCASLPDQLLESELFGHERGAFTGAVASKLGLLEAADGGTIFLDEIGELAPELQPKLLRALESGEIVRVGAVRPRKIDVRVVAATNRDLAADVESGRFRRDLFHRLNVVTITVPPLRERREDIAPLARLLLAAGCARLGLPGCDLSPAALAVLEGYHWPGNVRELRNVLERAALLAGQSLLEPAHLGLRPAEAPGPGPGGRDATSQTVSAGAAASGTADAIPPTSERARIENALGQCGGNQSRAAELLGMPRRTLVRRIVELGLPRPHDGSAR